MRETIHSGAVITGFLCQVYDALPGPDSEDKMPLWRSRFRVLMSKYLYGAAATRNSPHHLPRLALMLARDFYACYFPDNGYYRNPDQRMHWVFEIASALHMGGTPYRHLLEAGLMMHAHKTLVHDGHRYAAHHPDRKELGLYSAAFTLPPTTTYCPN